MIMISLLLGDCALVALGGAPSSLESLYKEREQVLVQIDKTMKQRFSNGLVTWMETLQAKANLLEFRRNGAASLQDRIVLQKEIVKLYEEAVQVAQDMFQNNTGDYMNVLKMRSAYLAAKCVLLEWENEQAKQGLTGHEKSARI